MLKSRFVVPACAAAIVAVLAATSAARGNVPHTTYFAFSAPVALPGVTLPGGTYIFEVMRPASNALVRVTSRDGRQVYLVAYTRTIDRPSGQHADLQLIFSEAPAGATPSVRAWFPLGERVGHEFLYPRATANP